VAYRIVLNFIKLVIYYGKDLYFLVREEEWCTLDCLRPFTFLSRGPYFIFDFRAPKWLVTPLV